MADVTNVPAIDTSEETGGMSSREARRLRRASVSAEDRRYMRRKALAEKIWPFFRAVILIGLGFVIMYPLLYMISCSFRERADMNDPTVVWIPRHFTLSVMKDTVQAMDFGNKIVRDSYGKVLGRYDKRADITRDLYGRVVAKGDQCTMLIGLNNK